jgi:iron complex outermembrane receptor protein
MNQAELSRTRTRALSLMCGASVALVAALSANGAIAQTTPANGAAPSGDPELTEVIVTGTSIRGQAPVGSSVVSVGQDAIQNTGAQTVQQVLRSVPSVVGMGAVGQGAFGSADGAGTNAPTIHGLGASASNSTLILIDGHRLPLSGINHALADPNILPPLALERVEVLADGASSVYGSDAVAGVINFITRRKFDGVEAQAQVGFADHYKTYSAGIVAGKTWDTGSVLAVYGYSDRDALSNADRDFTKLDKRSLGGSNQGSFFCGPATIQPTGSALIFTSPYNGAGLVNAPANAPCDTSGLADLIPSETRHSGMIKVSQEITERLTASLDGVYSKRDNDQRNQRGTVQATIFGPGSTNTAQINPFYTGVAGSTATSESVRFDANQLLGPGAHTASGETTYYVSGNLEYKVSDNWRLTAGGLLGQSDSYSKATGALCTSCALLALNGTTNGGGSLTTVSVPGTTTIILNTPLTAANSLDVFNVGSANRTSAAVLARLTDSANTQLATQTIRDATLKLDGELFQLPGGSLKVAVGGEVIYYTLEQNVTRPLGTGPATTGSSFLHLDYDRNVRSAFLEVLAPLVSPEMEVPFVHRLDVNVSGRYDKYSDFGSTSNPKVGGNWEVVEGFKLRANWAKSFVAPAFTSRGADANGTTAETSVAGGPTVNVPVAAYPNLIGLPGCPAGSVTCTLGGAVTGLQINGGNAGLEPQKGKSWAVGFDWNPAFAPGLRTSVTYWSNDLSGAITAPQAAFAVNAAGLNSLLTVFGPAGATPAQLAAITAGRPLTVSLPPTTYYVYNFQQRNALNLWVRGVDVSVNYSLATDLGRFGVDAIGSYKTKFEQQVGAGGAKFDVLGTTGFNTTFPSIKFESRVGFSWEGDIGLSANLFWNHTGSYRNWSGTTVTPIIRSAAGVPTGGGDKVKASDTFDAHLSYEFGDRDSFTNGLEVYADVSNLFDKDPVFYNNVGGYDTFSGNPIGRLISLGVRKRW